MEQEELNGRLVQDDGPNGRVLLVDDEPHLLGMYAAMVEDQYAVKTATSGERALEVIDDEVDVALLDRRMPGMSGDELARTIRERGFECRIAMVTAVEPELDVLEIPFDSYLVKPVRQDNLLDLIDHLLTRKQYSKEVQEFLAVSSRLATIESQHSVQELTSHEEYQDLVERCEELRELTQHRLEDVLESGEGELMYRDLLDSVTLDLP